MRATTLFLYSPFFLPFRINASHVACEAQTYFRSSLLSLRKLTNLFFGGREATTGNTSSLRRLPATQLRVAYSLAPPSVIWHSKGCVLGRMIPFALFNRPLFVSLFACFVQPASETRLLSIKAWHAIASSSFPFNTKILKKNQLGYYLIDSSKKFVWEHYIHLRNEWLLLSFLIRVTEFSINLVFWETAHLPLRWAIIFP